MASRVNAQAGPSAQPGPAQALWEQRRARPVEEPGAFCAALLGRLRYTLPPDVHEPTWRLALRHFDQRRPTEATFRRQLEQRAARREGKEAAGARVAAFLLREWERYSVAKLLGTAAAGSRKARGRWGRRPGAPRGLRGVRRIVRRLPPAAAAGQGSEALGNP